MRDKPVEMLSAKSCGTIEIQAVPSEEYAEHGRKTYRRIGNIVAYESRVAADRTAPFESARTYRRRDRADFCGFQLQVDEIPFFQIDFFLVGRRHYGLEGERRRSGFSVRSATGIKGKKANLGAEFGSASRLVTTNDAHAENYPIKVRWK